MPGLYHPVRYLVWTLFLASGLYLGAGGRSRARCLTAITRAPKALWVVDSPVALMVVYLYSGIAHRDESGTWGAATSAVVTLALAALCATSFRGAKRVHPYVIASFLVLVADDLGMRPAASLVAGAAMLLLQRYELELYRIWRSVLYRVDGYRLWRSLEEPPLAKHPYIRVTQADAATLRRRPGDPNMAAILRWCAGCMTALGIMGIASAAAHMALWPGFGIGVGEAAGVAEFDRSAVLIAASLVAGLLAWGAVNENWTPMNRIPSKRLACALADLTLRLSAAPEPRKKRKQRKQAPEG